MKKSEQVPAFPTGKPIHRGEKSETFEKQLQASLKNTDFNKKRIVLKQESGNAKKHSDNLRDVMVLKEKWKKEHS